MIGTFFGGEEVRLGPFVVGRGAHHETVGPTMRHDIDNTVAGGEGVDQFRRRQIVWLEIVTAAEFHPAGGVDFEAFRVGLGYLVVLAAAGVVAHLIRAEKVGSPEIGEIAAARVGLIVD